MSEWVELRTKNKVIRIIMQDIKAGDVFRINTPNFNGPWRKAATDALLTGNTWSVPQARNTHRGRFIYKHPK